MQLQLSPSYRNETSPKKAKEGKLSPRKDFGPKSPGQVFKNTHSPGKSDKSNLTTKIDKLNSTKKISTNVSPAMSPGGR